jgi:anti-sigma B factor antagonist
MKKSLVLLAKILLFAVVAFTATVVPNVLAKGVIAVAHAKPEKPPDAEAVAALPGKLKSGLSNLIGDEEAVVAELTIHERQAGDVIILDLEGKITAGGGTAALRKAIRGLLDEGKLNILLNLKGVNGADESGIGELVTSYTETTNKGGQLKLLNLQKNAFRDLLMITKFFTVFQTYDDEAEAIASFN